VLLGCFPAQASPTSASSTSCPRYQGSELKVLEYYPFAGLLAGSLALRTCGANREGSREEVVRFMEERRQTRLVREHPLPEGTVDMMFEPRDPIDPSVFAKPRIDIAQFEDARKTARDKGSACRAKCQ